MVSGDRNGSSLTYQYKEGNKVSCFTGSPASVWVNAAANRAGKFEMQAASPLREFEPVTIPLHPEYGEAKYPDENGKLVKNTSYKVEASDIADPSLRCWLNAMGFLSDFTDKECNSSAYAEEYMLMLNKNICVRPNELTRAPLLSYPYDVKPMQEFPFDIEWVFTWKTRCNP